MQNKYQVKPPLPFVPGSEFSGVVQAVGDGVRHVKVGDAVASIGVTGGFGTHAFARRRHRAAAARRASTSTTPRPSRSPTAPRTMR